MSYTKNISKRHISFDADEADMIDTMQDVASVESIIFSYSFIVNVTHAGQVLLKTSDVELGSPN